MADNETKPEVKVETGAPATENAAGETNDLKVQEQESIEVKPAPAELAENSGELEKKVKEEGDAEAAKLNDQPEVGKKLSDAEKEEKLVHDAVKQITFYLSDSNLPYDKFLFTQAQKSLPEGDKESAMGTGWIPLSTILSFKRMQEMISKSSRSQTICEFGIVNALRGAYPAEDNDALLEVSKEGDEIRRKKHLVPPSATGQMDRSVYAKGFPEEDKAGAGKENISQLQKDLEDFFGKLGLGKVNAVRMRRDERKGFKGSVFIEWATLESAKAFLALDPKPTFPGQSEPLETMTKKEYVDMKAKEKGIPAVYSSNNDAKHAESRPQNKYRPFNAFRDWRHLDESNDGQRSKREDKPVTVYVEGKEMEVETSTGNLKNPEALEYTSGKVARFEGANKSEESNPIALKNNLQTIHPTAFVDFERGTTSGIVFFKDVVDDAKLEALQSAKLTLGGDENVLTWTLIKDEEEKQFHLQRANKRASIALADHKSGRNDDRRGGRDRNDNRGGRGGSRGGRGRGRGRGGRNDDRRGRDDRQNRNNDRNEERKANEKKRERDDDAGSPQKGSAIYVPIVDSSGPAPDAKRVKTE